MTNRKNNLSKRIVLTADKAVMPMEKLIHRVFFLILTATLLMATVCHGATVMTMTTTSDKVRVLMAGSGAVTIDYGDGTIKKGTLSDDYNKIDVDDDVYNHTYSGMGTRTIAITGENITILNCKDNQLTSLDVSKNTTLKFLFCEGNQLTNLDVSKNIALAYLICLNNQLTSLDVGKNTEMTILVCESNQFTGSTLNALFETLHSGSAVGNRGTKVVYISNNPGTNNCNRNIATNRGWTVNS